MNAWLLYVFLCITPQKCESKVPEYRYYAVELDCLKAASRMQEQLRAKHAAIADRIFVQCRLAPR